MFKNIRCVNAKRNCTWGPSRWCPCGRVLASLTLASEASASQGAVFFLWPQHRNQSSKRKLSLCALLRWLVRQLRLRPLGHVSTCARLSHVYCNFGPALKPNRRTATLLHGKRVTSRALLAGLLGEGRVHLTLVGVAWGNQS